MKGILHFFSAVSKCEDISLVPQSATSCTISLKLFETIILIFLVSLDCKDALNVICQTLAFLLDISLKHCLFFLDNLWRNEFKWSENLAKGCSPNVLGLSTKALLLAFPWETEQLILESHPFSTEEK